MGNQIPMYGMPSYQMPIPNPGQVVIPQITVQPSLTPYQPTIQPQLQQVESVGPQLMRVKGMDGAKQFPTVPNAFYALFDEDENVLFFKVTDKNNYPVLLKRFRYVEEEEPIPQQPEYVTKHEYDSLLDEFRKLKEEVVNGRQHIQNVSDPEGEQPSTSAIKRASKSAT